MKLSNMCFQASLSRHTVGQTSPTHVAAAKDMNGSKHIEHCRLGCLLGWCNNGRASQGNEMNIFMIAVLSSHLSLFYVQGGPQNTRLTKVVPYVVVLSRSTFFLFNFCRTLNVWKLDFFSACFYQMAFEMQPNLKNWSNYGNKPRLSPNLVC